MENPMKLREALIRQSPSLELQRAALDEIARLDAILNRIEQAVNAAMERDNEMVDKESLPTGDDYHTMLCTIGSIHLILVGA